VTGRCDCVGRGVKRNREGVQRASREALSRDKTRTQVFDISGLGLVEMARKRDPEGLVEAFSATCPTCCAPAISSPTAAPAGIN